MSNQFFPHDVKRLSVSFKCAKCGNKIKHDITEIPEPSLVSDTIADSSDFADDEALCESCGTSYNVTTTVDRATGEVEVDGIPGDELDVQYETADPDEPDDEDE